MKKDRKNLVPQLKASYNRGYEPQQEFYMSMSLEEFNQRFGDLPDDQRRATARALKVKLPFEAKSVSEQLKATKIATHKTKGGKEREYVMVPTIALGEDDTMRSFWIRKDIAKEVINHLNSVVSGL